MRKDGNVYKGEGRLSHEKHDCTVIALSYACDISYEKAHKICKAFGRKDRQGFSLNRVFRTTRAKRTVKRTFFGQKYEITCIGRPGMTIKTFLKWRPEGTFVCSVPNHAFCIKDAQVLNQSRNNQRIKNLFEIVKR